LLSVACVCAYMFSVYFNKYTRLQLNPLELSKNTFVNTPIDSPLVFLGDSRAKHWGQSAMLPELKRTVLNLGVAGQTSAQVRFRFEQQKHRLSGDSVVVLQVGINDLKSIALLPGKAAEIESDCRKHIAAIVDAALAVGAKVIVTTIFPRGRLSPLRYFFWSADVDGAVESVNRYIHTLSKSNVVVMDTYSILVTDNGIIEEGLSEDFLHLNASGYGRLNQALFKSQDLNRP